jgi:hypothetical protein
MSRQRSSLRQARRAAVERLPESLVHTLVRTRHGEMPWQQRITRATRLALAASLPGYVDAPVNHHGVRARIVAHYDAHESARQIRAEISAALDAGGVDHAVVPGVEGVLSRIAVSASDRVAALQVLAESLDGREWAIDLGTGPLRHTPLATRAAHRLGQPPSAAHRAATVRVYPVLAAASGAIVGAADVACEIDFWRQLDTAAPRRDGGTHPPGTRFAPSPTTVSYLSPRGWASATSAERHWPGDASLPALFDVRDPVDLVYTWVDGADSAWLARKAAHASSRAAAPGDESADHDSRYASREELRYSLRSVAMYASWARKIFLVTDGQTPSWLDTSHPKIEVVDHADIFRDPKVLPVFNSHAIESQLHHIHGLSEQYLYLNDDVFFGRPVTPELFFYGSGLAKFFLSPATLDIDGPAATDLAVMSAAKNNRTLLELRFAATVVNKMRHTPHPQLRSVLYELETAYADDFARVSASRFRHADDLSITSALHHYYAYGTGRAVPASISYLYHDIGRPETERRLRNLLRTRHADVFCLNDHESSAASIAAQRELLSAFFAEYYPVPSPYELADSQSVSYSDAPGK